MPKYPGGMQAMMKYLATNVKYPVEAQKKGLPSHSIIVTSVLRTGSSVKKLRKSNGNASANSAHVYGTTFDVAYARFKKDGRKEAPKEKLKSVLADVLQDLRLQKKCYVRYEFKQGCFHITTR